MKNKILYLLFLGVDIFLIIMYEGEFPLVLLGFGLMISVIMFLLAHWLGRKISLELEVPQTVVHTGEEVKLVLVINNASYLPANFCTVDVEYENTLNGENGKLHFAGAVSGKGQVKITGGLMSRGCGKLVFKVKRCRVHDYLHLFYAKRKSPVSVQIPILPGVKDMNVVISERTRRFVVDGEEYEKGRSGDDPSEIYQIREFRQGDTMQRIHWKMTAKTDELMTKEFSMPKGFKILLLLDLRTEKGLTKKAGRIDACMEFAVSFSFSLLEQEFPHKIGWYDARAEEINGCFVEKEEEYYEMQNRLLEVSTYSEPLELWPAYQAEYPYEQYSTVLVLNLKGELWLNDRLYQTLLLDKKDLNLEVMELEV